MPSQQHPTWIGIVFTPENTTWLHQQGHTTGRDISHYINQLLTQTRTTPPTPNTTLYTQAIHAYLHNDTHTFAQHINNIPYTHWQHFQTYIQRLTTNLIRHHIGQHPTPHDHHHHIIKLTANIYAHTPPHPTTQPIPDHTIENIINTATNNTPTNTEAYTNARLLILHYITHNNPTIQTNLQQHLTNATEP